MSKLSKALLKALASILVGYAAVAAVVYVSVERLPHLPAQLVTIIILTLCVIIMLSVVAASTIFRNPDEMGVRAVYDQWGYPVRWVPYGWDIKKFSERVSENTCPIPNIKHYLDLSMHHPNTGEPLLKARLTIMVGPRPLDVGRACRLCSDHTMAMQFIVGAVYRWLSDEGWDEQRFANVVRGALADTGWYLLAVNELQYFPQSAVN